MISSKKGWVKIVEASLAVLIVVSTLFIVINSNREIQIRNNIPNLAERLLQDVATNNVMREKIISYDTENPNNPSNAQTISEIKDYMAGKVGLDYGFEIEICEADELCFVSLDNLDKNKEVYSNERIISSTLTNIGNPQKIKIYLWVEG